MRLFASLNFHISEKETFFNKKLFVFLMAQQIWMWTFYPTNGNYYLLLNLFEYHLKGYMIAIPNKRKTFLWIFYLLSLLVYAFYNITNIYPRTFRVFGLCHFIYIFDLFQSLGEPCIVYMLCMHSERSILIFTWF